MSATPFDEIHRRIAALQWAMAAHDVTAALIVQRADLFYLSGTGQDAHLLVPVEGKPQLLVRKNYERALEDSPIESISPVKSLSELKTAVVSAVSGPPQVLGMELDVLPVNNYRLYEEMFPGSEIRDISPLIKQIRMVKSQYEIEIIKNAAAMSYSMLSAVPGFLREEMSEVELAGLIEGFYRKHGHQGHVRVRSFNQEVFYGHIMSGNNLAVATSSVGPTGGSGTNASMPQGSGLKTIARHEPVQIDYVAVVDGYMADQARTFYLGEPPEKFRRVHEVALSIQNALAKQGTPGARAADLYDAAILMAEEAGFLEGFLGWPQPVPFVGHGVGLELDEYPVIGRKSPFVLQTGMVVALEPKFIFPGEGLAGIENTFVVTEDGLQKLTLFDDSIQLVE